MVYRLLVRAHLRKQQRLIFENPIDSSTGVNSREQEI
jgi:hypothetical protein